MGRMRNPAWRGEKSRSNWRNWVITNKAPSQPEHPEEFGGCRYGKSPVCEQAQLQHRVLAAGFPRDECADDDEAG